MPSGDPQRVWFEEMIERLRAEWHPDITFDEMVTLRDDLDAMLQRICSERQIRRPVFKCPKCGQSGEGAQPHVSVRAVILSAIRFNIGPSASTRVVEKAWKAYREQNGLDLYGKRSAKNVQFAGRVHASVE